MQTIRYNDRKFLEELHHANIFTARQRDSGTLVVMKYLKFYNVCMDVLCKACSKEREEARSITGNDSVLAPRELCMLKRCAAIPGVERVVDAFTLTMGKWVLITPLYNPTDRLSFICLCRNQGRGLDLHSGLTVFKKVLVILQDLIDIGIVHGDLNARNVIWYTEDEHNENNIRLTNLVFSHCVTADMVRYKSSDPDNKPPEVDRNGGMCHWEPRMVWELGLLLYVILHGRYMVYNWDSVPHVNRGIARSIRSLLLACLERNWLARPNLVYVNKQVELITSTLSDFE